MGRNGWEGAPHAAVGLAVRRHRLSDPLALLRSVAPGWGCRCGSWLGVAETRESVTVEASTVWVQCCVPWPLHLQSIL